MHTQKPKRTRFILLASMGLLMGTAPTVSAFDTSLAAAPPIPSTSSELLQAQPEDRGGLACLNLGTESQHFTITLESNSDMAEICTDRGRANVNVFPGNTVDATPAFEFDAVLVQLKDGAESGVLYIYKQYSGSFLKYRIDIALEQPAIAETEEHQTTGGHAQIDAAKTALWHPATEKPAEVWHPETADAAVKLWMP